MTSIIAVDTLALSINVLLVIHVIVCLLLALVVLMQRPKQEGLGAAFGGGLTDQAFGAQTTNVLQKGTVWFGTMFFIITLVLAILIGKRQNRDFGMGAVEKDTTEEVSEKTPGSDALNKDKPASPKEVVMPPKPAEEKKPASEEQPKEETPAESTETPSSPTPPAENKPSQPGE